MVVIVVTRQSFRNSSITGTTTSGFFTGSSSVSGVSPPA
jgi:hypothetical protein